MLTNQQEGRESMEDHMDEEMHGEDILRVVLHHAKTLFTERQYSPCSQVYISVARCKETMGVM